MDSKKIRDVWGENFEKEMMVLDFILHSYCVVSVDTEFPGFLRNTPRDALEALRYEDLKFNVENLKLIQLGLTLSDADGRIGGAWEFNFCNFDPEMDVHVPSSIDLLRKNGMDLKKMKKEGVDTAVFAKKFMKILLAHREIRWVTFHGLYDLAYVMKLVTKGAISDSATDFVRVARNIFGRVYDVKFIARYCHGLLGGELGLDRLAKILKVERCGEAHQAGSDSLLTACVFSKMKMEYQLVEGTFEGFLYGISAKIGRKHSVLVVLSPQQYYQSARGCPSLDYSPPVYCDPSYYPMNQYYVQL